MKTSYEDLFWKKVEKTNGGCWEWNGSKYSNGYGMVKQKGKNLLAHRVSWAMAHGVIPYGLYVLHKCDNRKCVNPDHLFLGTQSENIRDMDRKGRRAKYNLRGVQIKSAKLNDHQVIEIRNKYKPRIYTARMLAQEYNVSLNTIEKIIYRLYWKHI